MVWVNLTLFKKSQKVFMKGIMSSIFFLMVSSKIRAEKLEFS